MAMFTTGIARPVAGPEQPCYNLPPLPLHAPAPACSATTFLCLQCPQTCGFCSGGAAASNCTDRLGQGDCASYRKSATRLRRNANETSGYCEAIARPARKVLRWSVQNGSLLNEARSFVRVTPSTFSEEGGTFPPPSSYIYI